MCLFPTLIAQKKSRALSFSNLRPQLLEMVISFCNNNICARSKTQLAYQYTKCGFNNGIFRMRLEVNSSSTLTAKLLAYPMAIQNDE